MCMKIKDLPAVDRPQEKLARYGQDKLNNSELLAILLGSGKKGINVIELSKKIINLYGEDELLALPFTELRKISGVGISKACRVLAGIELGKRLLQRRKTVLLMSPKDVWNELSEIRLKKKEYFVVFYLDVKNQMIRKEIISIGILNMNIVHPREVFEPAIKHTCAQIIISHNHPSGDSAPSDEDLVLTKRLQKSGEILGIELIDHVIVTARLYFSFKEHKLL